MNYGVFKNNWILLDFYVRFDRFPFIEKSKSTFQIIGLPSMSKIIYNI